MDPLACFSPATRAWFERAFAAPTPPQLLGWPAIASREHVLIQAPTGSGKTLTAFLSAIDRLNDSPGEGLRVLYVSPLKALNYDIERNLRGPLAGLESRLRVGVRTGDTGSRERRLLVKEPPDILITTPESLYLMLTSAARETLRAVETLILDEVHAVAGTKRGAHLALSVERLERLAAQPLQRIGLSATQRPLEEIGRFVSGGRPIRARRRGHDQGARPPGRRAGRRPARARLDRRALAPGPRRRPGDGRGHRARRPVDLALDVPRAPAPGRGAPLDDRLRQQPPARRAPRAPPERARRARSRPRPPRQPGARAAGADRGGPEGGPDPVPRRHLVARARHRHGRRRPRDPGRVAEVGRARAPAGRPRRPRAACGLEGPHLSEVPGGPARIRRRRPGDAGGRDRGDADPAQPARRAGAADRRHRRRRGDRSRRPARARPRRLPVRRPLAAAARERPRHARRPLPLGRVRRASAAHRLGSHGRHDPGARRSAPPRGHERRARFPTAACSASFSSATVDAWASSTRRWSTRPAPARRSCSGRRPGGSRRSPATACSSRPHRGCRGPSRSGREKASAGRTSSARRSAPPRGSSPHSATTRCSAASGTTTCSTTARRATCSCSCASRRPRPGRCRATARSSSSGSATRSATGGSASSRRSGPGARAVGDGDRRPAARVARARRAVDLVRRRDRDPLARRRRGPDRRRVAARPGRGGGPRRRRAGRDGALRRPLPRERRPFAADPAPPPGAADAALAAAAQGAVAAPGGAQVRLLPGRPRDLPRVPPGRLRPAGAAHAARRPADAPHRPRRRRDRRRVADTARRCSSTTSRRTCTRTTRRRPSAARRRCRSTATCSASCSARRSCGTCSTPTRSAEVERQLRGAPRTPDELHDQLRVRGDRRPGEYDPVLAEPLLAERRAAARAVRGRGAADRGRGRGPLPRRARRHAAVRAPRRLPRGRPRLAAAARRCASARAAGPFTTAEANERFGRDVSAVLAELEREELLLRGELRPGRQRARVVRSRRPAPPPPRVPRCAAPRGRAGRA